MWRFMAPETRQQKIKHTVCTMLKSRITDLETPLDLCVTAHISYQPEPELDISTWNMPANIALADESFHKAKPIDVLIGTEVFFELLSVGQIKLGSDLPMLQKNTCRMGSFSTIQIH